MWPKISKKLFAISANINIIEPHMKSFLKSWNRKWAIKRVQNMLNRNQRGPINKLSGTLNKCPKIAPPHKVENKALRVIEPKEKMSKRENANIIMVKQVIKYGTIILWKSINSSCLNVLFLKKNHDIKKNKGIWNV